MSCCPAGQLIGIGRGGGYSGDERTYELFKYEYLMVKIAMQELRTLKKEVID